MKKRYSLKECWKYGKEELTENGSKNIIKVMLAFIEFKARNLCYCYYKFDNIKKTKGLLFEVNLWCELEYKTRWMWRLLKLNKEK